VGRLSAMTLIPAVVALPSFADNGHPHDEIDEQQFGTVHFPTSCAARVQKNFERGVALLHSFAFETAESTFRQVARDDPRCAMALWGIAKTFSRWGTPDVEQLKRGWKEIKVAKSLHAKTAREKAYIGAVAALYEPPERTDEKREQLYLNRMEKLYRQYPEDHEAGPFMHSR
jgi:hypothetical protein